MTTRAAWRIARAWLPVGIWATFIWGLGSDAFSNPETSRILRPLLQWLMPELTLRDLAPMIFFIRKLAHATEYGVLAIITLRAMMLSTRVALTRTIPIVLAIGALLAVADEWRQATSAARTGSGTDVLLDVSGIGLVVLAALVIEIRFGRTPFRTRDPGGSNA